MKKLLLLSAAGLVFTTLPAQAEHHEGKSEGKMEKPGHRLESADTNGDGAVDKAEFMASSEKHFMEMDTDGDGKITKAEIEKRREEWRNKMKEMRAARQKMMQEKKAGEGSAVKTPAKDKPAEAPAQ